MGKSGFNSILFDFDSIVDKELSLVKFIMINTLNGTIGDKIDFENYKITLKRFDKQGMESLKYHRIHNDFGLIRNMIEGDQDISEDEIFNLIDKNYYKNEKEILFEYASVTDMIKLIKAYKRAGEGVIKTSIVCENDIEKEYIVKSNIASSVSNILQCDRGDIDTSKYTRFIIGSYKSALKYKIYDEEEPKSILLLNFRENFTKNDSTLLRPELIISLGDIHDIRVTYAYDDNKLLK